MIIMSQETDAAYLYVGGGPRTPVYIFATGTPDQRHLNGDDNEERDQGQIIISSNEITDVIGWGIKYDAGERDGNSNLIPHPGSVSRWSRSTSNVWCPA